MVLNFIDIEIARLRKHTHGILSPAQIQQAVAEATALRVRPVVITAFSTMIGLVPIMLSNGTGADVTQRIAAPVLGGMLSVLLLSLLIFPVIYSLVLQFQEKKRI